MDAKEHIRDAKSDKDEEPSGSKEGKNDECSFSKPGIEEGGQCQYNWNNVAVGEEPGVSKNVEEDYERSGIKSIKKGDETSPSSKTGEKEDDQNVLWGDQSVKSDKDEKPSVSKEDKSDECSFSKPEIEEGDQSEYECNNVAVGEEPGVSKNVEEDYERSDIKRIEKGDETSLSKTGEKEYDQNVLCRDQCVKSDKDEKPSVSKEDKNDECSFSKREVEEGDQSKCKCNNVAVGEKPGVSKNVEEDYEQSGIKRIEEGDESTSLKTGEKENDQNVLHGDGKEDEPRFLKQTVNEDGAGVLDREAAGNRKRLFEIDEKEDVVDKVTGNNGSYFSRGDSIEDDSSALNSNSADGKPSVPNSVATETTVGFKQMDTKEDPPQSPYGVLQQISEEAVKVAGEAIQNIYFSGPNLPPVSPTGHRRSHSEIGTSGHRRTNSFQRLKMQMQKAWRGVSLREDSRPSFNPEVLANQKRQWYQLHSSKAMDNTKYKEPTSLFEHFIIVGLHPETNMEAVELAFAKRKKWEMDMAKCEINVKMLQHRGPQLPALEPQILFKYPPGKKIAMRPKDLAAFCVPGGVKARILERTPSLSDLNELVYGQEHLGTDDSSFIFSLKAADDATLYGVCLHVSEIVQRPPGILLHTSSPLLQSSGLGSRYLVSAPRCYCLLTRVPFFELHFEMLNSIIAQERLNRIEEFVSEISLASSEFCPPPVGLHYQTNGNIHDHAGDNQIDWMASAIPVNSAMALTAAAAGFIPDDGITSLSLKIAEPQSPDSATASEASDMSHVREVYRDGRRSYDNPSEALENQSDALGRSYEGYEIAQASPEIGTFSTRRRTLERLGSSESLLSSARSVASDDGDDGHLSNSETEFGDDLIMEWARDHKNELLQIVCAYHRMALPQRGSKVVFHPLEHLQAIEYIRPPVSALGLPDDYLNPCEASKLNAKLAAAEEAFALSIWTTATICRILSLETILVLVAGVLLEKQVVVVCPNLGVLSSILLSLVPMIWPFQWQSLLLPVLPGKMIDFLDAPVPFLVGIQNKPADLKIKTSNLIQVNVLYDQVKMCHLPSLPRRRELIARLGPIHARLAEQAPVARKHPVYRCNEAQGEAASQFLTVMREYMESLCSNLRSHTITSVQSNNDRVSLLLKDSFIDSFPSRDRAFIKLLVDTQLFSVLSDSRLSSFENGCL